MTKPSDGRVKNSRVIDFSGCEPFMLFLPTEAIFENFFVWKSEKNPEKWENCVVYSGKASFKINKPKNPKNGNWKCRYFLILAENDSLKALLEKIQVRGIILSRLSEVKDQAGNFFYLYEKEKTERA